VKKRTSGMEAICFRGTNVGVGGGCCGCIFDSFHFRSASFPFLLFFLASGSRPWEGYSLSVYAEACTRVFSRLFLNSLLHYLSFAPGHPSKQGHPP